MIPTLITDTGAGLVFEDGPTRAELLDAARAYLIGHDVHEHDAEDATVDHPGLVVRAFWGGDELGLVQEGHPLARPIRIVHVFVPSIVAAQDAKHIADEAVRVAAESGREVPR